MGVQADQRGFEEWVDARSRTLTRTAYLLTGDPHLAEDLVQDTLARVAQRWGRLSERPDPYAQRVLHNLAVDRWRRRRTRPQEILGDVRHEPRQESPGVERRLLLRDALARLTPKQRAVLVLRFYEDLTEVQTADVLGCSVSTVKSQTRQALVRVRALAPDLLAEFDESLEGRP